MAEGWTSLSASWKSCILTLILLSVFAGTLFCSMLISGSTLLTASIAASLARAWRSAPTNPCVTLAISSSLTSGSKGIPRVWMCRISRRLFSSGMPISISLSKRPGRRSAGSSASGLFVAPMTTTFPRASSPSIRVSSWETILFSISPETSSLFGAIESISSMKMMLGAFSCASLKICLSLSSLSP